MYAELGVDRLAAWTYRGGYGTVLAAPDALKLWDRIGENYKRLLNAVSALPTSDPALDPVRRGAGAK